MVPQQVAIEEGANTQVTADSFLARKRPTESQKRKLRQHTLHANKPPWEGANLKVYGVEILQKMMKVSTLILVKKEDPAVVSRWVQPLAENSILAYRQASETSGG